VKTTRKLAIPRNEALIRIKAHDWSIVGLVSGICGAQSASSIREDGQAPIAGLYPAVDTVRLFPSHLNVRTRGAREIGLPLSDSD
jgi:hypothetical protein